MPGPFIPTPADTQDAQQQLGQLRADRTPGRIGDLLEGLLEQLAAGKTIQVLTFDRELSTQQAAELLGISRPYLVRLIEEHQLPHRKIGPRRRLYLEDVLAFRETLTTRKRPARQNLTDDLQNPELD